MKLFIKMNVKRNVMVKTFKVVEGYYYVIVCEKFKLKVIILGIGHSGGN